MAAKQGRMLQIKVPLLWAPRDCLGALKPLNNFPPKLTPLYLRLQYRSLDAIHKRLVSSALTRKNTVKPG